MDLHVQVLSKKRKGKLLDGVLIGNKTFGRVSTLLENLGYEYEWERDEEGNNFIYVSEPEKEQTAALGEGVNDAQLTENFNLSEFECNGVDCGCRNAVKIDPLLVQLLQQMRDKLNDRITIQSGYRCPEHNRKVGGVKDSYHVEGKAADIHSPDASLREVQDVAAEVFVDQGIGIYRGHVHVDVRGEKARWRG